MVEVVGKEDVEAGGPEKRFEKCTDRTGKGRHDVWLSEGQECMCWFGGDS